MKLFSALLDIALLPVEIAKDIVTLGGVATERDKSYTREKVEDIDEDLFDSSS